MAHGLPCTCKVSCLVFCCAAMKGVTVTGYKGGCGKSMTAIHLATFFSERGKTLLVDSDPNRTAVSWSRRGSLPFRVIVEKQAVMVVKSQDWDWVVFDTPARPQSDDLRELAEGTSLLVLPTLPDIVSAEPIIQTTKDLTGFLYRALVTLVPPAPNTDGADMKEALTGFGVPTFSTTIRRAVGFTKAAEKGVPVRDLKGRDSLGWLDYQSLGKEILEVLNHG